MKKYFAIIMILCLFLLSNDSYAVTVEDEVNTLSEMSEEECISFLASQGVSIPSELQNYPDIGGFVKEIITSVENDPNCTFAFNYNVTLQFSNQIRDVVNAYYGNTLSNCASSRSTRSVYSLVDSETVGVWDEAYTEYNCYAYALGYRSSPTGLYFAPYPGYFSGSEFNINDAVSTWAQNTESDLNNLGYSCVYRTTDFEEIMDFANSHTIICLRKGDHPDFHYMRWDVNSWYHKIGNTHLLRYLCDVSVNRNWTNECSFRGIDYPPTPEKYYSGTIWYLAFAAEHDYLPFTYTTNHYHLGDLHYFEIRTVCNDCGDIDISWVSQPCSGPPCSINFLSLPTDDIIK